MTAYYISKTAILQAIDNAIDQQELRDTEYQSGLALYKQEIRDAWYTNQQPAWRNLRDYLSKALKNNTLITQAEVKVAIGDRSRYGIEYPGFFNGDVPHGSFSAGGKTYDYTHLAASLVELQALRDLLDALEGDRVAWSTLKAMGYEKLEWVFRAGAKLDIKGTK